MPEQTCPICHRPMSSREAVLYRRHEDCWVFGQVLRLPHLDPRVAEWQPKVEQVKEAKP